MPTPLSEFERELRLLEAELKRLEAEYNQFFAGRLPRLPWDQRARVDAMMKRFDRMAIQNTGDRFRFQTVQARWAAFTELWERQLKAQETGRRPGRVRGGAPAPSGPVAPTPPPERSAPKPAAATPSVAPPPAPLERPLQGVVGSANISDVAAQSDRVKELYERLSAAKKDAGEKPLEFDRFNAAVQAQVKKLGQGGREVAFQVSVKEGKVTLTANPTEES
jgi:hypothetical protein